MIRYLTLGGGALVMIGLLLAAPAFACGPGAYIQSNPAKAKPSDSVAIIGQGFIAQQPVQVHWGGLNGPVLAATTTSVQGQFRVDITVPADASVGQHVITTQQPGVEGGRTDINFTFTVDPVQETVDETPTDETPIDETPTEQAPVDQTPVGQIPVDQAPPEQAPADQTPVEQPPAPTPPWAVGPSPANAPAVGDQTPAPAARQPEAAPAATAPAAQAPSPTSTATRSQLATSTPARGAPVSEAAPEREPVGVAAEAYIPSTRERSLLAGAGITSPEALTAPAGPSVAEEPAPRDLDAATPVDTGGGTPWALVPLMLLAAGLLAASGAALTTEVRQRAKEKVKA